MTTIFRGTRDTTIDDAVKQVVAFIRAQLADDRRESITNMVRDDVDLDDQDAFLERFDANAPLILSRVEQETRETLERYCAGATDKP